MTISQTKINEQSDLVSFLQENPDVFKRHPQLLELLDLPDGRGGASSLLERQAEVLKARVRSYQNVQRELVDVVKKNEHINDQFADIICQLIRVDSLAEFDELLPSMIVNTFAVDQVSIKTIQMLEDDLDTQQTYEDALRRCVNNQTVCDNRLPSAILKLFFDETIESAALIPLITEGATQPLGVLALGSIEEGRYTPELGTDHLDRLGLMAGTCLARLQS